MAPLIVAKFKFAPSLRRVDHTIRAQVPHAFVHGLAVVAVGLTVHKYLQKT